jgi:hypothetical protein
MFPIRILSETSLHGCNYFVNCESADGNDEWQTVLAEVRLIQTNEFEALLIGA